jgi:hypothetical protein
MNGRQAKLLLCLGVLASLAQPRSPVAPSFDCRATFPGTLSISQLRAAYGAANVRTDSILLGEGEFAPGAIRFPKDLHRRVYIVWRDSIAQKAPRYVFAREHSDAWVSPSGIFLGIHLRQLERLNGRAFRMMAFDFDGSGAVASWEKGRLEEPIDAPCHLRVRVDSIGRALTPAERALPNQVSGDRYFSSAHPALHALNPMVSEMWLEYRD